MKVKIEVDLRPFSVPNFVLAKAAPGREEHERMEDPKYSLSSLDSMTLDKLCREFRNSVFQKAGKELPPEAG